MYKAAIIKTILFFFGWIIAGMCLLAAPPKVIIIDPGHGGQDPGASYKGVQEKDITLAVGLLVSKKLQESLPNVKIILTRDTDVYNSVVEKADIANKARGELFISLHVNSAENRNRVSKYVNKPYYVTINGKRVKKYKRTRYYVSRPTYNNAAKGVEIYIWASDRSDNKSEAISSSYENEEEHGSVEEDVPDINSPESKLLSQMYAAQFFKRSKRFADIVDEEMKKIGRESRGIKQRNNKGIWVLQATAMPAVLIELGYITNKEESSYLSSPEGQEELAGAIVGAIVRYVQ